MNQPEMASVSSTCEIVESPEKFECGGNICTQSLESKHSIEDDINRLFESISIRNSVHRNASKRPIRGGSSPASGIGISDPVSLKQALRGLCISQASEMAAMKKRLSEPSSFPGHSEAGTIKRLYRAVVVETNGSGDPVNEGRGNVVEISLVPERIGSSSVKALATEAQDEESMEDFRKIKPVNPPSLRNVPKFEGLTKSTVKGIETGPSTRNQVSKPTVNSARLLRPVFNNKSFMKRKLKLETFSASSSSGPSTTQKFDDDDDDSGPKVENLKNRDIQGTETNEDESPSSPASFNGELKRKPPIARADERSQSKDKGEFSQSSKSSIGDYSSTATTSSSESSNLSSSSRGSGTRPHMSKDLRWEAIKSAEKSHGTLNLKRFKLLKRLGCGDIGNVYLAELIGTNCLFALKVMESEFLKTRKKMLRAQTEREIMQMLDHPFLPTLYHHFSTEKLSCLVMEYCPV